MEAKLHEQKNDIKSGTFKRLASELKQQFDRMASAFVNDIKQKYKFPAAALERIDRLLHYTCLGGKYNRGGLVLSTVEKLRGVRFDRLRPEVKNKALACGWAIEAMQACFLVADDVMDKSLTRRGKPCWYKRPEVQLDAVNDSLILESFVYFLLKAFFGSDMATYCALHDLYREVSLQTQLGQMLDLTSQPQGCKDPAVLNNFTLDNYHHKTAFYSFYLPVAAGMIVCGLRPGGFGAEENDDSEKFAVAKSLSMAIGVKFQIQDDYLDCFGDYQVMGKVGTDIQDHKCTWLCAMALKLMTAQQRTDFERNYGKEEKENIEAVRRLYSNLGLPELYLKQEADSFASISALIQANAEVLPPTIFTEILQKIHLRQK